MIEKKFYPENMTTEQMVEELRKMFAEMQRLEERLARLRAELERYDQEAAEGYKKPSWWRWKKS